MIVNGVQMCSESLYIERMDVNVLWMFIQSMNVQRIEFGTTQKIRKWVSNSNM